jgi:hypothetical protein
MKRSARSDGARADAALPEDAEICANLWYMIDNRGFIYGLRIKLYVCDGSEEEKLCFLRSRAYADYLVATPFPLPGAGSARLLSMTMAPRRSRP